MRKPVVDWSLEEKQACDWPCNYVITAGLDHCGWTRRHMKGPPSNQTPRFSVTVGRWLRLTCA